LFFRVATVICTAICKFTQSDILNDVDLFLHEFLFFCVLICTTFSFVMLTWLKSLKSLPADIVHVISRDSNYVHCGGKPVAYIKVNLKKHVTLSKNDQIYTCSNNAHKILVLDMKGNIIRTIKNSKDNQDNFIAIQNIWAINDELVVSDGRAEDETSHLKIFTLDGVFQRSFTVTYKDAIDKDGIDKDAIDKEIKESEDNGNMRFRANIDFMCSITFVYSTVNDYYFIGGFCQQLQKEVYVIYTKNGEFVKEFQPKGGDTVDSSYLCDKDIVFVQNDNIYIRDQLGNLTIFDSDGNLKRCISRCCDVLSDISYHFLKSFVLPHSQEYVELLIDEYDDVFKLNFFNSSCLKSEEIREREILRFFIISVFVDYVAIMSTGRFLLCVKHGFIIYE